MPERATYSGENEIDQIFIRATSATAPLSPHHKHREWEVQCILWGHGVCRITGYPDIVLSPGSIICFPPDIMHSSQMEQPYRTVAFRIKGYMPFSESDPFVIRDNETNDFTNLCTMMLRKYIEDAGANHELIRLLICCMHEFIRCARNQKKTKSAAVERAKQMICENFQDSSFAAADVIAGSGYTENYFRARFREQEGLTPQQYLLQKRLEYAAELLRGAEPGHVKIKDVALFSGFNDPLYFSRVFRKEMGMTPTEMLDKNL